MAGPATWRRRRGCVKWKQTAEQSSWFQYPSAVYVRFRPASSVALLKDFGANELPVSEPFEVTSGPGFYAEHWPTWRAFTKNLAEYGGASYLALHPTDARFGRWIHDRHACGGGSQLPCPTVDENDRHSWLPAVPAALQVGERIDDGGETGDLSAPVLVGWKQLPRERRSDFVRQSARTVPEMPAYAVYAVRLRGGTVSGAVEMVSNGYSTFKSTGGLVGLAPQGASKTYDPTFTTWGNPAVHFGYASGLPTPQQDDTGDFFAQWQQRWLMHRENEATSGPGRPSPFDNPFQAQPGLPATLHGPVSGYEPRRGLFANESTLRLTAWVRQRYSASQLVYRVALDWERASIADSTQILDVPTETGTGVPAGDFETTQPDVRVVSVVPFARTGPNGQPRGRIVFLANDDIWLVEVPYEKVNTVPVPPTVRRVTPVSLRENQSPTGKGIYPPLKVEVSATRDVVCWTHAGKIHVVRWLP